MQPNIFNYATSELSQDAIICYILEWANKEYKNTDKDLYTLGITLVKSFLKNIKEEVKIEKIEIRKQYKHIDILCIVNNKYAIIIEDKVNTSNHSNQLQRYLDDIKKEFSEDKIVAIYYKIYDQSNYYDIKKNKYIPFLRKDILNILESYNGNNNIIQNYKSYIINIENNVQSYKKLDLQNWNNNSWIGFFKEIKLKLNEGDWGYVNTRSGGFMGFWFNGDSIKKDNRFYIYLQIEKQDLVIKLATQKEVSNEDRKTIRNYCRNAFFKDNNKNIKFKKYGKVGRFMSIAKLDTPYIAIKNNKLDIFETITNLENIRNLFYETVKEL